MSRSGSFPHILVGYAGGRAPKVGALRLHGQIFAPCKICIPHIPVGYAEGRAMQEQLPRQMVQPDGQGLCAENASVGLDKSPGEQRRGRRGWAKRGTVRNPCGNVFDLTQSRLDGRELSAATGEYPKVEDKRDPWGYRRLRNASCRRQSSS